ncbi:MAG: S1C family serine protease [Oscillospiraceae bacterium]|nr:S1C family serine protease [Oscillospiraceae bacterium]
MNSIGRGTWYGGESAGGWYKRNEPESFAPPPQKPKKSRTGMKAAAVTLCVLILIAATAYIFSDGGVSSIDPRSTAEQSDSSAGSGSASPQTASTEGSGIPRAETGTGVTLTLVSAADKEELTLQQIYSDCIDSVVSIAAMVDGSSGYYWGTGIVMSADGYILTNAHVISGTVSVAVTLNDGRSYEAKLVGSDTVTDIAVLKIEAENLSPAEFGDSAELSVGDTVAAIGNPLGSAFVGSLTDGIISAIDRSYNMNGSIISLIQTNAAINEGSSGGPLINAYGQVIGITNMKLVSYYSSATIEGIGFAIPTSTIKPVVDDLIAYGAIPQQPAIGITGIGLTEAEQEAYGSPPGVYVATITKGTDAENKLQVGDVITAVNGIAVASVNDINDIKADFDIGDTLTLTVWRAGELLEISLTLYGMNRTY